MVPPAGSTANGDGVSGSTTTATASDDALLASIETRLRNPFSSSDLSRSIDANPDPLNYLRSIRDAAFDPDSAGSKAVDRVVKLRTLVALMGLDRTRRLNDEEAAKSGERPRGTGDGPEDAGEADEKKTDGEDENGVGGGDVIWSVLRNAQADDEEWVRVVGALVQGKMYARRPPEKQTDGEGDGGGDAPMQLERSRGEEAEKLLKKANDRIVKDVLRSFASKSQTPDGRDAIPFYAPMKYHLLDPRILRENMPELYDGSLAHFTADVDAEVLKFDPAQEAARAAEEEREMEQNRMMMEKRRALNMNVKGSKAVGGGVGANRPGSTPAKVGGNAAGTGKPPVTTAKVGNGGGAASASAPPSRPGVAPTKAAGPGAPATGAQRGRPKTSAAFLRTGLGRGRQLPSGQKNLATPAPPRSGLMKQRAMAMRGRGGGVGMMASRKLGAPAAGGMAAARRTMGRGAAASAMAGGRASVGGKVGGSGPAGASAGGAGMAGKKRGHHAAGSSKMKMMDLDEVKDKEKERKLHEVEDAEDSRAKRRRKLREEAAARGIHRKGGGWGATASGARQAKSAPGAPAAAATTERKTPPGGAAGSSVEESSAREEPPTMATGGAAAATTSAPAPSPPPPTGAEVAEHQAASAAAASAVSGGQQPKGSMDSLLDAAAAAQSMSTLNPAAGQQQQQQELEGLQPQQQQQLQEQQQQQEGQEQDEETRRRREEEQLQQQQRRQEHIWAAQSAAALAAYNSGMEPTEAAGAAAAAATAALAFSGVPNPLAPSSASAASNTTAVEPETAAAAPTVDSAPEPQMQQPQQQLPQPQQQGSMHENWRQLLEKSNKISAEDRDRVERFFTAPPHERHNPTPDRGDLYRIKLHEEKRAQPDGGGTVKETLYLELDYSTFGFKKLRKIKKK